MKRNWSKCSQKLVARRLATREVRGREGSSNQNLPETPKNVQSAGFHTCFRYGNIVIPMAFALALFMHSKILPQIFLPQITGGCSNPCFCLKPEIFFSRIKMIAGNILCIVFFPIPEDAFILCIGFFNRFQEMLFEAEIVDSVFYVSHHGYIYIYIYIFYI